jgi:membrane protein
VLVFLLYSVLRLFQHIENAVNAIWGVEKARTFLRKFTDYLSIVLIAPILMIASSAATVYINTILKDLSKDTIFEMISPFLLSSMKLLPFVIMWFLFTFMYMIMPNKKSSF